MTHPATAAPDPSGLLLYIDPWSGVAGDMLLAALIHMDAARGESVLRAAVDSLGLPGVAVEVWNDSQSGLACTRVEVSAAGVQPLRTLRDLESILEASDLDPALRARASTALLRLAQVEAGLHGVSVNDVHFHELGAVDTIVDVVGCLALVDALGPGEVLHGPVPVGSGIVSTEHGRMGVPAPATLALLRGVPITSGPAEAELTTPTGALLLGALEAKPAAMPAMLVDAVGYGGGSRRLESGPNVLRVLLGRRAIAGQSADEGRPTAKSPSPPDSDLVVVLETVIDDLTPEALAYLQGTLLQQGALDAWWTPVFMKKGRPAFELTVLGTPEDEGHLVERVFRESSTFGIRRSERTRHVLQREWRSVEVEGGSVRVKVGFFGGEAVTVAAEFEDARRVAVSSGRPLHEIMTFAAESVRASLDA